MGAWAWAKAAREAQRSARKIRRVRRGLGFTLTMILRSEGGGSAWEIYFGDLLKVGLSFRVAVGAAAHRENKGVQVPLGLPQLAVGLALLTGGLDFSNLEVLAEFYIANSRRMAMAGSGRSSVVSFATRRVVKTWHIPGGGSPDMGNVSANGNVLWLTGRWNGVVYAIDVRSWRLLAKIPVGAGPHGLCVWPQPGRYSLGHTGILR